MSDVTLTIDGQSVTVSQGATLLQAARQLRQDIPTVCYHPHFTPPALCRVCVVEVEKSRVLVQSCSRVAEAGMVVHTASPRVQLARKVLFEMLASAVDLSAAPEIQAQAETYGAERDRYGKGVKRRAFPLFDDNPFYIRDYAKCIMCWRCVQACGEDVQYTFAIYRAGRGFDAHISTFEGVPIPESTCVYCGNCVQACPSGALQPRRAYWMEQGLDLKELARVSNLEQKEKSKL
ncbi:MAG: NADP-reducing hydrogenase subunit HndD [Anaerolineae bacterium]|nr:NADP-reducing hydrogenase subunit HndD [Anaerolineae bacterium]